MYVRTHFDDIILFLPTYMKSDIEVLHEWSYIEELHWWSPRRAISMEELHKWATWGAYVGKHIRGYVGQISHVRF